MMLDTLHDVEMRFEQEPKLAQFLAKAVLKATYFMHRGKLSTDFDF